MQDVAVMSMIFRTFSMSVVQRRRFRNCPEVQHESDFVDITVFSPMTTQASFRDLSDVRVYD